MAAGPSVQLLPRTPSRWKRDPGAVTAASARGAGAGAREIGEMGLGSRHTTPSHVRKMTAAEGPVPVTPQGTITLPAPARRLMARVHGSG